MKSRVWDKVLEKSTWTYPNFLESTVSDSSKKASMPTTRLIRPAVLIEHWLVANKQTGGQTTAANSALTQRRGDKNYGIIMQLSSPSSRSHRPPYQNFTHHVLIHSSDPQSERFCISKRQRIFAYCSLSCNHIVQWFANIAVW